MDLDGVVSVTHSDSTPKDYEKALKDAEHGFQNGFSNWLNAAKELGNSNARLAQSVESQRALISALQSENAALTKDNTALQSSHDALVDAKGGLESDITALNNTVQIAIGMIGTTLDKLKNLENEKNACKARVETLEFDLAASDALAEALETELAKFRAAHANDYNAPRLEGDQGQGMSSANVDTINTALASNEQIQSLQASLDRLQRKYNRLLSKKESAEQRFYASYVEWQGFKEWWCGFSKFTGVPRKIFVYNRDIKSGAWIPGAGSGIAPGGKGRILRFIAAAEGDPKAFPKMPAEDVEPDMEADKKVATRDGRDGPIDMRKQLEEFQESYEFLRDSTTAKGPTRPGISAHTPRASEVTLPGFAQRPDAEQEDDEHPGAQTQDDSFDPEKTQETTPAKSQKQAEPFKFNLAGLNLPPVAPNPPAIQPILERPRLLSPEPSQVVVTKDESQGPEVLLRATTITPVQSKSKPLATTINSNKPATNPSSSKPPLIGLAPPPPTSTLGKRKPAREEDATPGGGTSRRPVRVELQLQYMDGTIVPNSESSTKRRRGLEDDDDMGSPSVRTAAGKARLVEQEETGSRGKKSEKSGGGTTTPNGRYEINPNRNGGLNFAYDEVVRKKDERKKMEAGACPDCIEYYKAVGPMPPRAQAPLWKSPTSSQEDAKNDRPSCGCRKEKGRGEEDDDTGGKEIAAHQQQISRHRYHFPAPATPPGYWDLGFPDTQRVSEINEKAERLHERKERDMEMEARKSDGKYRRR